MEMEDMPPEILYSAEAQNADAVNDSFENDDDEKKREKFLTIHLKQMNCRIMG